MAAPAITPPTISRDDLASPWQRLGAGLIDGVLLVIPFTVVLFAFFVDFGLMATDAEPTFDVPVWYWPLATLIGALYHVVPEALWGQTLGKHLVKIRVCSGRDLGRPGWARAAKRWIVFVVVGFVPYVGNLLSIVIVLPIIWDKARQGLHDKFADTLVLRNDSVPWA